MQIHAVYLCPYAKSFAFSVTWKRPDGVLLPESTQVELALPGHALGRAPETLKDIYIEGVRLELDRTGPYRAERLEIAPKDYFSAVQAWQGDLIIV